MTTRTRLYSPFIDNTPVSSIRIVAHYHLSQVSSASLGHWSIYLCKPNNGGSTRINMRAIRGEPRGILDWTAHSYDMPITKIMHWDWPVSQGSEVQHFANFISALGRDQYTFSAANNGGCRYWVATVLSDFANAGLIRPDAFQSMLGNMRYQYYENTPPTWLDVIPGTFGNGYVLPEFR
ncbi:hypothetical protein ACJ72_07166 [Emergomyces africanus]|uniref:DUF7770 domain-containing protein n=1 Tax=Emergomyces africanus TaxID=1955775 RepID=A0A1B7NPC5_9EURO|nr:hypothetical protein ACJ72_07166 [Emergomyces africanus]